MSLGARLAILDSSAIIDAKNVIPPDRQWEFFEGLKERVRAGQVFFPRAVRKELRQERYHDTPETWALNVYALMDHSYEPAPDALAEVMRRAGDVVEVDAEGEPADPHVLAQAMEFTRRGHPDVVVVTQDHTDRLPIKIAMTTACGRLGLASMSLLEFLDEVGFDPKAGWTP